MPQPIAPTAYETLGILPERAVRVATEAFYYPDEQTLLFPLPDELTPESRIRFERLVNRVAGRIADKGNYVRIAEISKVSSADSKKPDVSLDNLKTLGIISAATLFREKDAASGTAAYPLLSIHALGNDVLRSMSDVALAELLIARALIEETSGFAAAAERQRTVVRTTPTPAPERIPSPPPVGFGWPRPT